MTKRSISKLHASILTLRTRGVDLKGFQPLPGGWYMIVMEDHRNS